MKSPNQTVLLSCLVVGSENWEWTKLGLSNSDFPKPKPTSHRGHLNTCFQTIPHPLKSTNTSPTVETLANEETRTDKICSSIDIYTTYTIHIYIYILSIKLSPPPSRSKSFGIRVWNFHQQWRRLRREWTTWTSSSRGRRRIAFKSPTPRNPSSSTSISPR